MVRNGPAVLLLTLLQLVIEIVYGLLIARVSEDTEICISAILAVSSDAKIVQYHHNVYSLVGCLLLFHEKLLNRFG